ncbi:hypothetical protein QOZ80_3AG0216910 [Eleusine coracana subsp. coracana]|nr:hypothetical protein QOZ80_3AG0216910 [Eleusine coracana subsp. coracana]
MLARIIFCVLIAAAVLAVVLLATVSPIPHRSGAGHKGPTNLRTFTVYIHPATSSTSVQQQQQRRGAAVHGGEASALVFRHRITSGPENTSRHVGAASGFLLPAGEAGHGAASSVFDMVHLAFDAPGMSGSLCVEASNGKGRNSAKEEEELEVVGGTGAFAFARGHAVVTLGHRPGLGATAVGAPLRVELSVFPAGS